MKIYIKPFLNIILIGVAEFLMLISAAGFIASFLNEVNSLRIGIISCFWLMLSLLLRCLSHVVQSKEF